jgi:hypothetical protein
LECLALEVVIIVYGHLDYFMDIWYILWPFGIFYGHFGIFYGHFGMLFQEKLGNPGNSQLG